MALHKLQPQYKTPQPIATMTVSAPSLRHKIVTRMMKLLTRWRVLVEEQGQTYMADKDSDSDEAARPRLHLIRFHGVLALNAKLRAQVVTQEPDAPAQAISGKC